MMNYYGLNIPLRALLMTLLFVCANTAVVLFIRLVKRKQLLHAKVLLPVVMAVNTFFCVMFATEARATKFSRELPEIVKNVCEMPIIVCILLLLVSFGYLVFAYLSDFKFRKTNLSRASIKESLDKLPTGLCFYRENGKTVLVNNTMNNLCFKIVGRDLQNAKLFWEILTEGEVLPEIERISSGEHPSFRLTDGKVWTFSRAELEDVIQLVAADTTDLSDINQELKIRIDELYAINKRLREYGEQVDELTRARERVDIKAQIHRELGQALLITRRYVLDETDSSDAPIFIWKKNVAMLIREASFTDEDMLLSDFLDSAHSAGVKVVLSGELPSDKKQNALCLMAAVECLVNGVRHADAKTLYITASETENEISITYENDGVFPNGDIVEGGGLSSLRQRAIRLGGSMVVKSTPRFSLTIILPKEGGNQNG